MPTDTSEKGLEALIVKSLIEEAGYLPGLPEDYDRDHAVDLSHLLAFLKATQPKAVECARSRTTTGRPASSSSTGSRARSPSAASSTSCARASSTARSRVDLFYGTPTPGNAKAADLHAANRFSVTRQLRYSQDETQALPGPGVFINGLPVATFELKNSLTKQTCRGRRRAVQAGPRSRKELIFQFGRCVVHFAVDDSRGLVLHRNWRARSPGSCRSTRARTTAPATRRTRTGSRPTTSGRRSYAPA